MKIEINFYIYGYRYKNQEMNRNMNRNMNVPTAEMNELYHKVHTDRFSLTPVEMKRFDDGLIERGGDLFFGHHFYTHIPNGVLCQRYTNELYAETIGSADGDYVCFDIYSRGNKRSLRIHNDLLNKISEEDYLNNRFPFKLEWLGKNSKIKQPSYYPTHKSGLGNQNNPLPLKYLLFPEKTNLKYIKIRFLDGDRLHWSPSNIQFMSRKQYNAHPNKNNITILDEWIF